MPKVNFVYLIASHNNIEQLQRLVDVIARGSPKSLILIHHDYSCSSLESSLFKAIKNVQIMEDFIPIKWGGFSQVDMELKSIEWLFKHSYQFDWLVFLSGQDYPICALDTIEKFYKNTEYDGFMDYFNTENPRQEPTMGGLGWKSHNTGQRRYFYRYYKLTNWHSINFINDFFNKFINRRQSLIKLIFNRSGLHFGVRRLNPIFNSKFKCYAGSNWHTFSYKCIKYICEFIENNPEFFEYYQRTLNSDESFFQTILLNQTELKIFNDNLRYIAWNGCTPYVWKNTDFQALINSKRHFARKFSDKVDKTILDRLDQYFLRDNKQLVK